MSAETRYTATDESDRDDLRRADAWERRRRVARATHLRQYPEDAGAPDDDGRCASCGDWRPLVCAGLCARCNAELDASARGDA